ncbi:hypothetical protein EV182_001708 [Spiromyces aspiralis]|uniref:Uncharacterized protein n=1 Tax=Spiromyces aspiralis TaxID=68401 RepID=A0ACC1HW96_9FUNG|nr:hypothetical protein EV182_001708 [Spiromyces aspiralis]
MGNPENKEMPLAGEIPPQQGTATNDVFGDPVHMQPQQQPPPYSDNIQQNYPSDATMSAQPGNHEKSPAAPNPADQNRAIYGNLPQAMDTCPFCKQPTTLVEKYERCKVRKYFCEKCDNCISDYPANVRSL